MPGPGSEERLGDVVAYLGFLVRDHELVVQQNELVQRPQRLEVGVQVDPAVLPQDRVAEDVRNLGVLDRSLGEIVVLERRGVVVSPDPRTPAWVHRTPGCDALLDGVGHGVLGAATRRPHEMEGSWNHARLFEWTSVA